ITNVTEKKQHMTRYVDFKVADIWELLPSFLDASNTATLIANCRRLDLISLANLADYHVQFLTITNFLISKHLLCELEQ
ncbi:hypothetical protein HYPSUDRAFT_139230, partial [Hypholoma sublateritium FD-334 SS-4]